MVRRKVEEVEAEAKVEAIPEVPTEAVPETPPLPVSDTLANHDRIGAAAGSVLAAMAQARAPLGRKRAGMNPDDVAKMVRLVVELDPLLEGKVFHLVKARMKDIAEESLDGWKDEAYSRARNPGGVRRMVESAPAKKE